MTCGRWQLGPPSDKWKSPEELVNVRGCPCLPLAASVSPGACLCVLLLLSWGLGPGVQVQMHGPGLATCDAICSVKPSQHVVNADMQHSARLFGQHSREREGEGG